MNKMKYDIKVYNKNIYSINYEKLIKKGIKLLIFDLDNTLGLVGEEVMPDRSLDLLNILKDDFYIVVASNNNKGRVAKFVDGSFDFIHRSLKPTRRIERVIKKKYKVENNECAIIGDQIVTDIRLGNKCGYYTILVDPLGKYGKVSFFNRILEKRVKKKIQFKDGEYFEEN